MKCSWCDEEIVNEEEHEICREIEAQICAFEVAQEKLNDAYSVQSELYGRTGGRHSVWDS